MSEEVAIPNLGKRCTRENEDELLTEKKHKILNNPPTSRYQLEFCTRRIWPREEQVQHDWSQVDVGSPTNFVELPPHLQQHCRITDYDAGCDEFHFSVPIPETRSPEIARFFYTDILMFTADQFNQQPHEAWRIHTAGFGKRASQEHAIRVRDNKVCYYKFLQFPPGSVEERHRMEAMLWVIAYVIGLGPKIYDMWFATGEFGRGVFIITDKLTNTARNNWPPGFLKQLRDSITARFGIRHPDFHQGNVMVRKDGFTQIIDWDPRSGMHPPIQRRAGHKELPITEEEILHPPPLDMTSVSSRARRLIVMQRRDICIFWGKHALPIGEDPDPDTIFHDESD